MRIKYEEIEQYFEEAEKELLEDLFVLYKPNPEDGSINPEYIIMPPGLMKAPSKIDDISQKMFNPYIGPAGESNQIVQDDTLNKT